MSYKALLFCPDEKTARTVTQVLSELDFQVEASNEPFATVKKLTAEHFDAIVVDCESEQNATLLFKSARNSALNQASLSIAVVEGQAGVAKAFRLGANLVLTKPINVEQSKGTIRVARGLLRKSESAKPAASPGRIEPSTQSFTSSPRLPVSPVTSTAVSTSLELEREPVPQLEPAEAALLESMRDPVADLPKPAVSAQTLKPSPWQPISKPMADALQNAAEATRRHEPSDLVASPTAVPFTASLGTGVAAAPAKQKLPVSEQGSDTNEIELPSFASSMTKRQPEAASDAGNTKRTVLIAAGVLIAVGLAYVGWTKTHPASVPSSVQKTAPQTQLTPTLSPPNASPTSAEPSLGTESEISSDPNAGPSIAKSAGSSIPKGTSAPKLKNNAIASTEAETDDSEDVNAPDAIVVKRGTQKPVAQPQAPAGTSDAAAPALSVAQGSENETIAGLVDVPTTVPKAAPQTVKVSQGVSQGLLVNKVAPVYPQQALQMKIQGSVEIAATISKGGNITHAKLLSGDAILGRAALEAVKQWKYKPYYLDSQPVEIQTQITVVFKLP